MTVEGQPVEEGTRLMMFLQRKGGGVVRAAPRQTELEASMVRRDDGSSTRRLVTTTGEALIDERTLCLCCGGRDWGSRVAAGGLSRRRKGSGGEVVAGGGGEGMIDASRAGVGKRAQGRRAKAKCGRRQARRSGRLGGGEESLLPVAAGGWCGWSEVELENHSGLSSRRQSVLGPSRACRLSLPPWGPDAHGEFNRWARTRARGPRARAHGLLRRRKRSNNCARHRRKSTVNDGRAALTLSPRACAGHFSRTRRKGKGQAWEFI